MQTEFFQALFIVLREGLEAMLMVGSLAVYMAKIGHSQRVPALYIGAALAVAASLVVAWILHAYLDSTTNLLVEGLLLFFASGLMLYVSGWLFIGAGAGAWQRYLRWSTDRALARNAAIPIVGLAFFVVFREGLETAIFLAALAQMDGVALAPIAMGAAIGVLALGIVAGFMRKITGRLPLRPIFLLTSGFLFVMGIVFIGEVVAKFQQLGYVPHTVASCGSFMSALGLCSSQEAIAAQLAVFGASAISLLLLAFRARSRVRPI